MPRCFLFSLLNLSGYLFGRGRTLTLPRSSDCSTHTRLFSWPCCWGSMVRTITMCQRFAPATSPRLSLRPASLRFASLRFVPLLSPRLRLFSGCFTLHVARVARVCRPHCSHRVQYRTKKNLLRFASLRFAAFASASFHFLGSSLHLDQGSRHCKSSIRCVWIFWGWVVGDSKG